MNFVAAAGIRRRIMSEERGSPLPLSEIPLEDRSGCLKSLRRRSSGSRAVSAGSTIITPKRVLLPAVQKSQRLASMTAKTDRALEHRAGKHPAAMDVSSILEQNNARPGHRKRDSGSISDSKGKGRALEEDPPGPAQSGIENAENMAPWQIQRLIGPQRSGSSSSAPDEYDTDGGA